MPLPHQALVFVTDGRKTLFFRNEGDQNQIDLRTAVWDHPCVHMLPGTYNVTVPITCEASSPSG